MTADVIELNGTNFDQEVLGAKRAVLVQFWAGWSDPCRAMNPMLQSVAEDDGLPVKVGRVNVEHDEELAQQYGVQAVPTLFIFKRGSLQDQIIGRTTEQEVRKKLERFK